MGDVEIVVKVPEGVDKKMLMEKVGEVKFWEDVRKNVGKVKFGEFGKGAAEEFDEFRAEVYEQ